MTEWYDFSRKSVVRLRARKSVMSFLPLPKRLADELGPLIMAVVDDILAEREDGFVRCGLSRVAHQDILELAREFGLHADRSPFAPITASDAIALVTSILHKDMAYRQPMMAEERAKELALQFLGQFGAGAKHFSNGWTGWKTETTGWNRATDATFDTGVLIVGNDRSGCIWVEDED